MRRVKDIDTIRPFFQAAADIANKATCQRARCGSVIIKDGEVLGRGNNGPPLGEEANRVCDAPRDYGKKQKYDITCCVHAEWRAIINACKQNGEKIAGSTLYFMRIDEAGNFTDAGRPFCTVCSRITMEAGIAEFALWNDGGADIYTAKEYDKASSSYYNPSAS